MTTATLVSLGILYLCVGAFFVGIASPADARNIDYPGALIVLFFWPLVIIIGIARAAR